MTEREVVMAALAVALAAAAAIHVPWWCLVVVAIAAAATRRASFAIVVLAASASFLAARAEAGLAVSPGRVDGIATVVSDPEPRPGGSVLELRYGGHRYRAFAAAERAPDTARAVVGDEIHVSGRIGVLAGPWEWRAARHLSGRLTVESAQRVSGGAWWWRSANWLRRTVESGTSSFSPEARALFLGVVLGDDRGQSEVDRFRFRSSGLAHLTAVSGQNVAFVLVAVSPLLRRVRLRWRWSLTVGLLCWFAVVTRLEPSVLRAVAMAIVASTGAWLGRYVSGLRVVSVAVIGLVLVDPLLVWSVGFRLSVGASVALVTLARPLAEVVPGPRLVSEGLAVSLAAQVGTAPLLLGLAGTVPVLGPAANLLAVPVAGWLMVWGVVTGPLAGVIGGPVAAVLGWPSRAMVGWLTAIARWFSEPSLPRLGVVGVVGSSAAVVALVVRARRLDAGRLAGRTVLAVLAALGVLAVVVDAVGVFADRQVTARGVTVWSDGSAAVMVLGGAADEEGALSVLVRCRCGRLDVVVVTGGGRTTSAAVHALRQVVEVGVVLASDPSEIRDARQLVPGTVTVGDLSVDVSGAGRVSRARTVAQRPFVPSKSGVLGMRGLGGDPPHQ